MSPTFWRWCVATCLLVLLSPGPASACTCLKDVGSLALMFRNAEFVVWGRAASTHNGRWLEVTFEVLRAFKGVAPETREVVVHTGYDVASCGVTFTLGSTYLILPTLQWEPPVPMVDLCNAQSSLVDEAQLERILPELEALASERAADSDGGSAAGGDDAGAAANDQGMAEAGCSLNRGPGPAGSVALLSMLLVLARLGRRRRRADRRTF